MAMEAAEQLAKDGIGVDLLAVATVKPIDEKALAASASKTKLVLAVEEHNIYGGFGGAVAEALAKHAPAKMEFIGVKDRFTESGPYDALMKKYGISVEAMVAKAKALVAAKLAETALPVAARARGKKAAVRTAVAKAKAITRPAVKKALAKKAAAKKATPKKTVRKKR
jgi:hypothetical protein